ncbi:VOC family protein [Pseudoalteromonas sp. S16_S37]|uniref:VOC family protein n=1 Tax=Pseudoalteromonas sp. S16_S37 TaxID=2720228 RepID=UPI00167FEB32|nr:VOC family protein [Pseudoalteromonas sp. S16_S37]MBD1584037.1 VOC family protein [Pseudoalteromonas sp. S16_S37]
MQQELIHIALVVNDYDEAIAFYTKKLGFELLEDTYLPDENKRWVVIAPPGSKGATILLARASNDEQRRFVGNQSGGRVFLFLHTQNFDKDYTNMLSQGIEFVRKPSKQDYGTVAVFKDLYGNLWDLLELKPEHSMASRLTAMH